jgi:hypothetical protein
MVVGFTSTLASVPITTKVVSLNLAHGAVYSIQHYVIKFVGDLRHFSGFLQVLRFPPPIMLTATPWKIILCLVIAMVAILIPEYFKIDLPADHVYDNITRKYY